MNDRNSDQQPSASVKERSQQDVLYDECNVFVKYLPPDLSDSEFHKLFKPYGVIVSSKIMMDQGTGKSLGYGFVRYYTPSSAQKAIQQMNGTKVQNKRLLCKLANLSSQSHNVDVPKDPLLAQTPSDNLYIKPLSQETTEDDLRKLFSKFGFISDCKVMVDRVTGQSRQIGFVRFANQEDARRALDEMNNKKLESNGPSLIVKFADTKEQKNARKFRQKAGRSPTHQTTTYFYSDRNLPATPLVAPFTYNYWPYSYSPVPLLPVSHVPYDRTRNPESEVVDSYTSELNVPYFNEFAPPAQLTDKIYLPSAYIPYLGAVHPHYYHYPRYVGGYYHTVQEDEYNTYHNPYSHTNEAEQEEEYEEEEDRPSQDGTQ